eukprot:8765662-Pyramimonas_sp.AAC.1
MDCSTLPPTLHCAERNGCVVYRRIHPIRGTTHCVHRRLLPACENGIWHRPIGRLAARRLGPQSFGVLLLSAPPGLPPLSKGKRLPQGSTAGPYPVAAAARSAAGTRG